MKPPKECPNCGQIPCICDKPPKVCPDCGESPCICEKPKKKKILKIKLRDGKEREIQHMISTSFWGADGKPISSEEFIKNIYGVLPDLFKSEEELRKIWSSPVTRKEFLNRLFELGIDVEQLENIYQVMNAQNSDLYDVLAYLSFNTPVITRKQRVENSRNKIFDDLNDKEKEFVSFVLSKYERKGFEELEEEKLPVLLNLKYHTIADAERQLGDVNLIRSSFFQMQKNLYSEYPRQHITIDKG